jgi:short-subunit dehydrogenase
MGKVNQLSVLITGAAAGIGRATAMHFLKNGHTVYALDLHLPDIGEPLQGDITSEERMRELSTQLKERGVKLDGILHFAGVHTMASFLENDFEKTKRLFEINLFGAMLVNKTFYPLLKKNGRVLITTSEVAPLAPLPFNGLYSVSKTALDSYAQALRQELNLLGQKVITLRPGAVATELEKGSAVSTERLCRETELFQTQSKNFCKLVKKFTGKPMSAEKFGRFVYKIFLKKRPKATYAKNRHLGLRLLGMLPLGAQCFLVKILVRK